MDKKIGIVIVNYNGEKYQNDALRSIYHSSYNNFEIIIVDSNSSDNSIKLAQESFSKIHFLPQNENVGVAKGNNIGIDYAINVLNVDYVLLSNNDIIMDRYTIEHLVNNANEETVTVPKIYYFDNKNLLWFAGGYLDWNFAEGKHYGIHSIDDGKYNSNNYIDYAPTCCMLIHKKILNAVGKIDEDFFMYYDDTDLCVRIIEHGFKILYIYESIMWHKESSSSGGIKSKIALYYLSRNKFYYIDKYKKYLKIYSYLLVFLKFIVKYFSIILNRNSKYIWVGYIDYINNVKGRKDNL